MKNLTNLFGKKETTDYDKYYRDDDDIYDDVDDSDDDVTTYGDNNKEGGVSFNSPAAPVSLKVV